MSHAAAQSTYRRWITPALILLGVFFSLVWYRNFEISQIDNSETLTFMKMFRDRALYPSSFLLSQTYSLHLYSVYYWIAGYLALLFDPYWVLYAYFIVINCLCVTGIYALANTITKNRLAAMLSVLALTLQGQWGHALAGSSPFGLAPYPDQIATALLLFSLSFYFQGRTKLAFAVAGATFSLHASFSVFILFALGVDMLLQRRFKDLASASLIGGALALPMFIYILLHPLPTAEGTISLSDWVALVRLRSGGHTMPLSWTFGTYVRFLPYPLLFLLGYRNVAKDLRPRIAWFCAGIFALCAMGTLFAEIWPIPMVIKLTLVRSSLFFVIVAVILFCSFYVQAHPSRAKRVFLTMTMAGVLSASFPFTFAGLAGLYGLWVAGRKKIPLEALLVPALLAVVVLFALKRFDYAAILEKSNGLQCALVSALLCVPYFLRQTPLARHWKNGIVMAGIALTAFLSPVYNRYSNAAYFHAAKDLQLWLRDNTPPSSLVILPPSIGIWSGLSERGDTFSYVELGYPIYAPHLTGVIFERFRDYLENPLAFRKDHELLEAMTLSYEGWDEAKFREVGRKYGSRYAVVSGKKALTLPVAYKNDLFAVYKIDL